MVRWRLTGRKALLVAAVGVVLTTAACSSTPTKSASSTTTSTAVHDGTKTSTARATSTTGAATTTTGTQLPQTASGSEFYSPSKNISCEIDAATGPGGTNAVLCLTLSPPRSATLTASGTLTNCSGPNCLANAGVNTPTLPYGFSITLGAINCLSMSTGMKCTLGNGDGFVIATAGVTPLGGVTVTTSTAG
jgi:hypothetical protein